MYKFFIIFIILFPLHSFAQVEITEIMYDATGSDNGFEWVEIYNSGPDNIAISDWHFYENNVHHRLTPEGFSILNSGDYALIVQNIENIQSQYPSINLIKSSFSLSNTGENLAISDFNKNIISSVLYDSEDGAGGDGLSLQKSGSSWVAATVTPGSLNNSTNEAVPADSSDSTNNDTSLSKKESSSGKKEPPEIRNIDYYTGFLNVYDNYIARDPVRIEAYVTHTKGLKTTKQLKSGKYLLNFGDGTILETDERIMVDHIYEYPGEYELVFEFYSKDWHEEYNREPTVFLRKTIHVEDATNIMISEIGERGGISIMNQGSVDVNLHNWNIRSIDGSEYIFPKHSYLKAGKNITISYSTHGLENIYNKWVWLRNSQNVTISSFTTNSYKLNSVNKNEFIETTEIEKTHELVLHSNDISIEDTYALAHPEKEVIDFTYTNLASDDSTSSKNDLPRELIIGVGIFSLILVILRILYIRKREPSRENEIFDDVQGEIELIE